MSPARPAAAADADDAVTEPSVVTPPRPAALGAILAAGASGIAGVVAFAALAVIGWLATSGGTASDAVRIGVDGWLLAHGVPLTIPGGTFALPPLGLSLAVAIVLYYAGGWVGRTAAIDGLRSVAVGVGVFAAGYGALGAVAAMAAGTETFGAGPLDALLRTAGLAVLAGGAGLVEACGLARAVWRRLPDELRSAVRAGRVAVVVLVGCSALVFLIALALRADRLAQLAAGLRPGLLGTILLVLLCLAFLPNAVLFTMAYVLGPGVALGTQTAVAPSGVELGPLPAFPLLAAVPAEGAPPWWLLAVLAFPFAAGVVAGLFLARRHPLLGLESAALYGGLAGLFGGTGVAVLAAVSGGAAGPGRMADFGPSAAQVALVAVITLTIAGALSAAAVPALREWRRRRQVGVAPAAR